MTVINVEGSTSFNPDEDRLYDPNEIIKYCSSLVSVSTAQSRPVYLARNNVYGYTIGEAVELRLAHFSVKEFLISEHAVYSFRMSDELANISLTRACLAMLLHFDSPEPEFSENPHDECTPTGHGEASEMDSGGFEGITLNRIPDLPNLSDLRAVEKFPFVKYAAQYWITHYLALGVSAKKYLHDLCLRLFDCQKSPYINWLRFFSPGQPFEPPKNLQRGWISPPLYTAALAGLTEICRLLLQSGADINEQGGRFGNALQASIFSGNTETVALLLENGADINRIGGPYLTAMQAAVASGNMVVLDMLLDHGADINVGEVDLDKFFAVGRSYPHSGRCRLPSSDMAIIKPLTFLTFTPPKKNATALQSAAFHGQLHMVERLVERGANIHARAIIDGGGSYRSETGRRFVHTAVELAASEGHTDIIDYLLRKGASLETRTGLGNRFTSCLQLACRNGHFDTAKFLLEQGANIDAVDGGSTALQEAAGNGHMAILCFLLEARADVHSGESTTVTGDSYTGPPALCRAAVSGREDMVELLLGKGAKIEFGQENDSRGSRDSALIGAATNGHRSIVNLLIAHGADVNLSHYYKGSPLHMAAQHGHETVCRILLDAGADVNKLTRLYKTSALYRAVESNHTEVAQLLIQRGADVNTPAVSQDSQRNAIVAGFSCE